MTMTDPVADMLTRLRNAMGARHKDTTMPGSRLKAGVARVLKETRFIEDYELVKVPPHTDIKISLKYADDGAPVVAGIKRVSRPGRRKYCGHKQIPRVLGGIGVVIMSTSKGLMTGREAYRRRLGGEVLAYVW